MFEPDTVYAKIAYDAILLHVKANTKLEKRESDIPQALKLKLGCHVTIYDANDNKRGSYGTPEPKQDYLFHAIIENAIKAAEGDKKHPPVKVEELSEIKVHVEVLSPPKKVEDPKLLKPEKHGIILETSEGDKSIVYPSQDGIDTPEKMLETVKKKADMSEEAENNYTLNYFTITTYK